MHSSVFFQGGTLVLQHADEVEHVLIPFQFVKSRRRCEAYHYHAVLPWLREHGIRNDVPRWKHLTLKLHDTREPHDYQLAALDAWNRAGRRGSIILPTGAGKTFVAMHAISQVNASTVVIVPTISLVHQWYARLVKDRKGESAVSSGSSGETNVNQ
jgi:superfamily II DNA or RNA helicase